MTPRPKWFVKVTQMIKSDVLIHLQIRVFKRTSRRFNTDASLSRVPEEPKLNLNDGLQANIDCFTNHTFQRWYQKSHLKVVEAELNFRGCKD